MNLPALPHFWINFVLKELLSSWVARFSESWIRAVVECNRGNLKWKLLQQPDKLGYRQRRSSPCMQVRKGVSHGYQECNSQRSFEFLQSQIFSTEFSEPGNRETGKPVTSSCFELKKTKTNTHHSATPKRHWPSAYGWYVRGSTDNTLGSRRGRNRPSTICRRVGRGSSSNSSWDWPRPHPGILKKRGYGIQWNGD